MADRLRQTIRELSLQPAPPRAPWSIVSLRLELSRERNSARAWAETLAEANRPDYAALFAQAALVAYARVVQPATTLSAPIVTPFGRLPSEIDERACAIGRAAADLPELDALHALTGLYPALLSDQRRAALGAFYTPPALAARLLDQAEDAGLDLMDARVLDPAAGGGIFLVHVATRMRERLRDSDPTFALARIAAGLHGFEVDPHAAGLAQNALELALADLTGAAGQVAPAMIQVCDTLEQPASPVFDLVVGNPPYGRVALTPDQRRRYARGLYGHANLYGVFTDIALRWTRAGGLIAYLTPTSFLAGQYFSALRNLLATEAPPVGIDFVHARAGVFDEVLQETVLAVYRKGAAAGRVRVHYLELADQSDAEVIRNGTIALPVVATDPWLAPRIPEHSRLIATVETMSGRLAALGYGVSTGPLVWNRHKDQLRDQPGGEGVHPLIWAEAIAPDGRFIFRAEKRGHHAWFKLAAGDGWLLVDRPCVLLQRTTAKEQARRLIAAELPPAFVRKHGGVVVENHLNMVRVISEPLVSPKVIAALLNSNIVDQVFRCISGSVAVSAFELEALPLPSPADLQPLEGLISAGADRTAIEAECGRLYGAAG